MVESLGLKDFFYDTDKSDQDLLGTIFYGSGMSGIDKFVVDAFNF